MSYVPLLMGWASSSMRAEGLAFLAASLTVNASGLNCTWSIVSLTMGLASSFILRGMEVHLVLPPLRS